MLIFKTQITRLDRSLFLQASAWRGQWGVTGNENRRRTMRTSLSSDIRHLVLQLVPLRFTFRLSFLLLVLLLLRCHVELIRLGDALGAGADEQVVLPGRRNGTAVTLLPRRQDLTWLINSRWCLLAWLILMKQLTHSAVSDEDHVVQSKTNKTVGPPSPRPSSSDVYGKLDQWGVEIQQRWSVAEHLRLSPLLNTAWKACHRPKMQFTTVWTNPPCPPRPRFRDSFNWIKEGLPQNFVPAVTAPVPLTAVQVTDANLLKSKKRERLTSSSLEESATAAPCTAASLRFHLSTLARTPCQPLKERVCNRS